jgi:hypothetical protein
MLWINCCTGNLSAEILSDIDIQTRSRPSISLSIDVMPFVEPCASMHFIARSKELSESRTTRPAILVNDVNRQHRFTAFAIA